MVNTGSTAKRIPVVTDISPGVVALCENLQHTNVDSQGSPTLISSLETTRSILSSMQQTGRVPTQSRKRFPRIDRDAFGFAIRMSLVLTTASLFVLVSPDDPYKQGSWVYITCCMVSWFPASMDAASVLKKTFHRILGTTLGSILALVFGFATAAIEDIQWQATFLGLSIAFLSFTIPYIVVTWNDVFGGYSYASVLVLMTFGIAVFPFYNSQDDRKWEKGCYRIANVIIGCLLSAAGAIFVMPKTTHGAIQQSVARQIILAGETSEAVLHCAYDVFSNKKNPIPLAQLIQGKKGKQDHRQQAQAADSTVLHKKYTSAVKDFQSTKSLFPLLDYDPFFVFSGGDKDSFRNEAALNLDRAFRIQTTVVLLDSLIRNDKGHQFTQEQLDFFYRTGYLIKNMLKVPFDPMGGIYALELSSMLSQVRSYALQAASDLQRQKERSEECLGTLSEGLESFVRDLEAPDGGQPVCIKSAAILFLELVEHLILRTLRLYMRNRKDEDIMNSRSKRDSKVDGDDDGDDDGRD